ncbi:MAG TPA: VOC family protein [Polyangia bacterium]|nr:VOC family protein [Polyangia bacterium]
MIDHVSVRVQDFSRAVEFYRAALAPLGYSVLMEFPGAAGLGTPGKPDVWLMQTDKTLNPTHLALSSGRAMVDAFHAAALAAGGTDNGSPGVRADYHPHYYAAFILDPEGNNIEVVCHADPNAKPAAAPRPAARKVAARKPAAKKAVAKAVPKAKKPAKAAPRKKPAAKAARSAKKKSKR